jgi:hypothetical protein
MLRLRQNSAVNSSDLELQSLTTTVSYSYQRHSEPRSIPKKEMYNCRQKIAKKDLLIQRPITRASSAVE